MRFVVLGLASCFWGAFNQLFCTLIGSLFSLLDVVSLFYTYLLIRVFVRVVNDCLCCQLSLFDFRLLLLLILSLLVDCGYLYLICLWFPSTLSFDESMLGTFNVDLIVREQLQDLEVFVLMFSRKEPKLLIDLQFIFYLLVYSLTEMLDSLLYKFVPLFLFFILQQNQLNTIQGLSLLSLLSVLLFLNLLYRCEPRDILSNYYMNSCGCPRCWCVFLNRPKKSIFFESAFLFISFDWFSRNCLKCCQMGIGSVSLCGC